MQPYDKSNYTYGFEIEWGDVDRRIEIPEQLGSWEYAETDIVNLLGEHAYKCCDPLGVEPPFGGEINTKPTKTWQEQVERIFELKAFFEEKGNTPTINCISHNHMHVRVPGLRNDIAALKRLTAYIKANQSTFVERVYGWYKHQEMDAQAVQYLKFNGGRLMPDYMCDNILNRAVDFDSFIKMHAAGKDGVSMGRPFRYAINTYSLKHIDTIEFRCFRASLDRTEIESQFKIAELFIDAALNDGPPIGDILDAHPELRFAPLKWSFKEYKAWKETKYDASRGKKARVLHDV
jgi:hypothetical protein